MKKDLKVNELWLLLSLVISTGSVVSGCGKDSTKSSLLGSSGGSLTGNVSLTCGASDQYDSYMMPIFTSAVPAEIRNSGIPVYIDHQFTSVQQQSLVKALQQWNTILLQKNGHRIFQIQTEPLMNGVMPETLADCSFGVSEYQYAILLTRVDALPACRGVRGAFEKHGLLHEALRRSVGDFQEVDGQGQRCCGSFRGEHRGRKNGVAAASRVNDVRGRHARTGRADGGHVGVFDPIRGALPKAHAPTNPAKLADKRDE
jgi:hypothetical protein